MEFKQIFIGYAREDRKIAESVYTSLAEIGLFVWIDYKSIMPGENWKNAVKRGISNSRYFIALLSRHSIIKRGFVQKELRIALDILEEFPPTDIFIVPVRIDDCQPTHEKLLELNWVDLFPSFSEGIEKLKEYFVFEINKDESYSDYTNRYRENYYYLSTLMSFSKLNEGIRVLEHLHGKIRDLVNGKLYIPLDYLLDGGYGMWHSYFLDTSVSSIAKEGWVFKHLTDITLLAKSPVLAECHKTVIAELFGVEAFHIAIQGNPVSDNLVKTIYEYTGDRKEFAKRIAGQMTFYISAYGSYPPLHLPPFAPSDMSRYKCYRSTHYKVFDAVPVNDSETVRGRS